MDLLTNHAVIGAVVAAVVIGVGGWLTCRRTSSEDALLTDWTASTPPWAVFKLANGLAALLDWLRDAVTPPPIRALQQVTGYTRTQVLGVLAHAKIADHVATGPKTTAELASLTGLDEAKLFRVLRLAVAQGLLAGSTDRAGVARFRNNGVSATLREDHPNCTRYMVLHQVDDCFTAWSRLWSGLESGKTPWDLQHPDEDIWSYFRNNPEVEQVFSKAMVSVDHFGIKAALADYDFGRFSRIIDVGGAMGSTLAAVLRQQPHASGVLFDLPQVIERAKKAWGPGGQFSDIEASRVEFAPGSFFDDDTVPAAKGPGDLFLMRVVLHDWPDEKALEILSAVRRAIAAAVLGPDIATAGAVRAGTYGATLAIVEMMPSEALRTFGITETAAYLDVHMLALQDGMERTKSQWEALFKQTGFRLTATYPTRSPFTVTEAGVL